MEFNLAIWNFDIVTVRTTPSALSPAQGRGGMKHDVTPNFINQRFMQEMRVLREDS